jgi:nitrite reductase (NO-forming)
MNSNKVWFLLVLLSSLIFTGCGPQSGRAETSSTQIVEFSLQSAMQDGRIVYLGVGGEIDGLVNPDLVVPAGTQVIVSLINGDGMTHNISFPDFDALSALVSSKGSSVDVSFDVPVDKLGTYSYYCSQPGHRQAGQEGRLVVTQP